MTLRNNDKLFYYTTTGWMMWNWLVGGLATGSSIYLFDGAPTYPKIDILVRVLPERTNKFIWSKCKKIFRSFKK